MKQFTLYFAFIALASMTLIANQKIITYGDTRNSVTDSDTIVLFTARHAPTTTPVRARQKSSHKLQESIKKKAHAVARKINSLQHFLGKAKVITLTTAKSLASAAGPVGQDAIIGANLGAIDAYITEQLKLGYQENIENASNLKKLLKTGFLTTRGAIKGLLYAGTVTLVNHVGDNVGQALEDYNYLNH